MKVTQEVLARFIDRGYIEIKKGIKLIRFGEISTAKIVDGKLIIALNWLAEGDGYEGWPHEPKGWTMMEDSHFHLEIFLKDYLIYDLPKEGKDNIICLQTSLDTEESHFLLFPNNDLSEEDALKIAKRLQSIFEEEPISA